jgi:hypothetical protein
MVHWRGCVALAVRAFVGCVHVLYKHLQAVAHHTVIKA